MSNNFWQLSDGQEAEITPAFDMGGGELIPNDTGCIATIEEATWKEYMGDRYINLKWRVLRPSDYANRVVFQKVKIYGMAGDKDPQAASDKAKRMLAAIDSNSGGGLRSVEGEPTDDDLMRHLTGKKPIGIKVMVWEIDDKKGNWIAAVAPPSGGNNQPPARPRPAPQPVVPQQSNNIADDDIPF